MDDPYATLGVHPDAGEDVIEAAYRTLVKKHHPDSGGDADTFKEIQTAYDQVMSDESPAADQATGTQFEDLGETLFGDVGTPVETESVRGTLSSELVIDRDPLTIALTALFRTDISDFVWDHKEAGMETADRFLAVFHIENTSANVEKWSGAKRTSFVGTDGHTYEAERANVIAKAHRTSLSSRFATNFKQLEPGTKTNGVVVPVQIPSDVDIDRIVYTHKVFEGDRTDGWVKEKVRYEFEIEPEHRHEMRQLIAE